MPDPGALGTTRPTFNRIRGLIAARGRAVCPQTAAPVVAEQRVPGVLPELAAARPETNPTSAEAARQYDPDRVRQLFLDSGCAACHRIAGTEANGLAGPDLTHVGSRLTLGAGILPNNRGTMIGWIGDSQSIKPGNRMPAYPVLTGQELRDVSAWLESLK